MHLIKSLGRGGAEKLIPETASVHDQTRFEFHCLYFYHQESNIVDELESAGIQVHLIPSGNLGLFFQIWKVREFVKEYKVDIIHSHLPWAGILSRLAGRKLNVPIVYTEHNTWDRYNTISYWGNRLTFKQQDVAIAVSNEVALSMQLNSIFDPYRRGGRLKVKVIQNGVNTEVFRRTKNQETRDKTGDGTSLRAEERSEAISLGGKENKRTENKRIENKRIEIKPFPVADGTPNLQSPNLPISNLQSPDSQSLNLQISNLQSLDLQSLDLQSPNLPISQSPNLKSQLQIPPNAPVFGKVAVFRSQKRLWIWVDIALKILEQCQDAHFLLVGDGEWRDRILDQIRDSGKGEHFHWVGVQKQVIPFLSVMDIYLSTSEFEGLPIAMLEAMSCEVPVVATRAGGIGEMVQHGVQGFLTEIEDFEDLVQYAVQLIRDPDLHARFAASARARVLEQFSMKRMVRELEEVYESVIAQQSCRACLPKAGEREISLFGRGKENRRLGISDL